MVEFNNDNLSQTLKAVSDSTRRALLTQLCQQGPSRVTDLASDYDMSLNAISKHIKVLEKARLVSRKNIGRTHWIEADLRQIGDIENWLNQLKSIWELRLDRLEQLINNGDEEMSTTELTVNLNKTISAPIGKVFDAWLDPEMLSQFILPAPGMPEPQVENSPSEGGEFTITMQVGDRKEPHTGKYLEINRPDKLAFTWVSPRTAENSTVTILFTAINENKTDIDLTHIRFVDEESRSDHEGGWKNILDKLDQVVA